MESFLVFPTSSTMYDLCGGLGAAHGSWVVDGITLSLSRRG